MSDDFDPEQAATMLMQQHGDNAAHYAAQWATAMLEAGNHRDARRFERISQAIQTMTRGRPERLASRRRSPRPRRPR